MPSWPVPANRSSTWRPSMSNWRALKSPSFTRSVVGRVSVPFQLLQPAARAVPVITRMVFLSVPPALAGAGDQQDQPVRQTEQNGVGGGECLSIQRHGTAAWWVMIYIRMPERVIGVVFMPAARTSAAQWSPRRTPAAAATANQEDPRRRGCRGPIQKISTRAKGARVSVSTKVETGVGTDLLLQRPVNSKAADTRAIQGICR